MTGLHPYLEGWRPIIKYHRNYHKPQTVVSRGQAELEDFPLLNNEFACRIPEGKPKIPLMRWVYRNMKIVVLQIQQHHSPTLMESLK